MISLYKIVPVPSLFFRLIRWLISAFVVNVDYRDVLRAVYSLAPNGESSEPCLKLNDLEKVIPPYSNAVVWFMIYDLVTKKFVPRLEALDDKWKAMVKFNRIHGFGKIRARALYVVSWEGFPKDGLMETF